MSPSFLGITVILEGYHKQKDHATVGGQHQVLPPDACIIHGPWVVHSGEEWFIMIIWFNNVQDIYRQLLYQL